MAPFDRFTVVLDACTMFPMLVRDVLLTLAAHEFFNPKWSPRIREEWMRNLLPHMAKRDGEAVARSRIDRIAAAVEAAFPNAIVTADPSESATLEPVDAKDRHVVLTAIAAQADAIITFNVADFAVPHLSQHLRIEVIHPDDFVMDLVDLNEKRAVAAFRELRARKKNPPWETPELIRRLRAGGLVQTAGWLSSEDVVALI